MDLQNQSRSMSRRLPTPVAVLSRVLSQAEKRTLSRECPEPVNHYAFVRRIKASL